MESQPPPKPSRQADSAGPTATIEDASDAATRAAPSRADKIFAWIESHFRWLAPLVFLLLTLSVLGDVLVRNDQVLGNGDIQTYTVPYFTFLDREFHQGNFPTWNPHSFGGTPLAGNINVGMFYPLHWFHYFLPLCRAINLMLALHIFLAGWFMSLWCRGRGLAGPACIFAGIAFMLSGPLYGHLYPGHPTVIAAAAMMPLIFLAIDKLFDSIGWRQCLKWILVGSLAIGLQVLSGFAQLIYYTALVAGIYALLRSITLAQPWRRRVVALLLCGSLYLAGPAIGAIQLLPGLALRGESIRAAGVDEAFAARCSLPPEMLASALAPHLWGDLHTTPFFARAYLWETSLFLGCSTLLLALYGAIAAKWKKRHFTGSLLVVTILLAMGSHIPWLFHFLFKYLPGYANLRTASRWNELAALFGAMLAALGLDRLLKAKRFPLWLALAGIGLAAAVAAAALTLRSSAGNPHGRWSGVLEWLSHLPENVSGLENVYSNPKVISMTGLFAARQLFWAALTLAVAAGAVALIRVSPKWAAMFVVIVAVEMIVYARGARVCFSPATADPTLWAQERQRSAGPDGRVFHPDLSTANRGLFENFDDVYGYDPVSTLRYGQFLGCLALLDPGKVSFPVAPDVVEGADAFQRAHGMDERVRTSTPVYVPYLRLPRPVNPLPFLQMMRCHLVLRMGPRGPLLPVRVPNPLPHLMLLRNWKVIEDRDQRLAELTSVKFDPHQMLILEQEPNLNLQRDPTWNSDDYANTLNTHLRVVNSSTDGLEIDADTPGGVLLVTDAYADGWHVKPLEAGPQSTYEVLPADQVLRAIPLLAGHHHFLLEYSAPGFTTGKILTALAAIGWLVGIGVLLIRRRPAPAR